MSRRPRSVADLPDFSQPPSGLPSVAARQVAPPPVADPAVVPQLPPYRPVSRRLKGLIVLLTLATVLGLAALMLEPHRLLMGAKAARATAQAQAACPPDAASAAPGCPGSTMPVLVLPLPASPPAVSPAPAR